MIVYHRTSRSKAQGILANGFRDDPPELEPSRETRQDFAGVWVQARPPAKSDGRDALLRITLALTAAQLAEYEWQPEATAAREWLLPATVITTYGKVEVITG